VPGQFRDFQEGSSNFRNLGAETRCWWNVIVVKNEWGLGNSATGNGAKLSVQYVQAVPPLRSVQVV